MDRAAPVSPTDSAGVSLVAATRGIDGPVKDLADRNRRRKTGRSGRKRARTAIEMAEATIAMDKLSIGSATSSKEKFIGSAG